MRRPQQWQWSFLLPWIVPVAVLSAWQWSASSGWLPSRILPGPLQVVQAAWKLTASGELPRHFAVSFVRASAGFAIGATLGFVLGLFTGTFRWADRTLDGSMQMLRTIPHLALIPLAILWFGVGEQTRLFLVALGVLFPVYVNTYHGVRTVDPGLIEIGRVYGLNQWQLFRTVLLPGAMPSILVGIRYALGVMWLTLIVAETIAATSGIGYMAMSAREFLYTDVVLLSIVLYAFLGKGADIAARALERRWLRWHPAYQLQMVTAGMNRVD